MLLLFGTGRDSTTPYSALSFRRVTKWTLARVRLLKQAAIEPDDFLEA
jgi:hypothetical protein